MIKKAKYNLIIIFFVFFYSCKKDKPEDVNHPVISNSANAVYIVNEGNFQFGNAEISYYDALQSTVSEDLFKPVNNRPLGDVCQSMHLFNSYAYIVMNNSNKIEVVNENTFVSVATITGFTSPRYFLPISNNKAYVTDIYADKISIVDLNNNVITGTIPCKGWTEQMQLVYGKVFVTNEKSDKVFVINTLNDLIEDSITVGYAANSIAEDKNSKLWVLCSGDSTKNIFASIHRINPVNNTVEQSITFPLPTDNPWRLHINGSNDTLYYLDKGVWQLPVTANTLSHAALIAQGGKHFYGLGIDPQSDVVYVSDAIDYVQRGIVYRYHSDGTMINNFLAGIIPGDFYFR